MTIPGPSTIDEHLLWSQVILIWLLANYGWTPDPAGRIDAVSMAADRVRALRRCVWWRSGVAAVVVAFLPGATGVQIPARLILALLTFSFCIALPLVRLRMAAEKLWNKGLAEWELVCNALFLVASAGIIGGARLSVLAPLIELPLSAARLRDWTMCGAAVVFVIKGGTHVVRGILDKVDTLPLLARVSGDESEPTGSGAGSNIWLPGDYETDLAEYNRGRLIGHLERLLLLAFVVSGDYGAVGFLIAAKGLVRIRELQDRRFAEYFLIGTLSSVLVAVLVAVALRGAIDGP